MVSESSCKGQAGPSFLGQEDKGGNFYLTKNLIGALARAIPKVSLVVAEDL